MSHLPLVLRSLLGGIPMEGPESICMHQVVVGCVPLPLLDRGLSCDSTWELLLQPLGIPVGLYSG